jgi:hypothetical protein
MVLLLGSTLLFANIAGAGVIIDVNGTTSNATITATVVGSDVFLFAGGSDVITFWLLPNDHGVSVQLEGPLGATNSFIVRGPVNGSYLNLVRISMSLAAPQSFDQYNPVTSSSNLLVGNIADLAVFDGVTSFMTTYEGTGPNTNVTLNYNVEEAVSVETATWGSIKQLFR